MSGPLAPLPTVLVSPGHYGIAYSASAPGEDKKILFVCKENKNNNFIQQFFSSCIVILSAQWRRSLG